MVTDHIDVNEQGIALSKQLAWVIMVALVSGGFYVGTTLSRLEAAVAQLQESRDNFEVQMQREISSLEIAESRSSDRVRVLEADNARDQERLVGIFTTLTKIESSLTSIDSRLRKTEGGAR